MAVSIEKIGRSALRKNLYLAGELEKQKPNEKFVLYYAHQSYKKIFMSERMMPQETRPSPEFAPIIAELKSLAQHLSGMPVPQLKALQEQMNRFLDNNEVAELRGFGLALQNLEPDV